jgi:hypothetical protein
MARSGYQFGLKRIRAGPGRAARLDIYRLFWSSVMSHDHLKKKY